jgi:hypothetical protein
MMADSGRLCSANRAFPVAVITQSEAGRYSDRSLGCHIIRTEVRQILSKTTLMPESLWSPSCDLSLPECGAAHSTISPDLSDSYVSDTLRANLPSFAVKPE